jgi:hypothetical protein
MLISTKEPVRNKAFNTQRFIESQKFLVENFKNWTCKELGITKPVPVLEVLDHKDDFTKALVAVGCDNFVRHALLQETSRADLPNWIKNGLALITTSYADDLTNEVISEQPLDSRQGKIHFMDITTEKNKGKLAAGVRMFDALRGFIGTDEYSSFNVTEEPFGVAGGTDFTPTAEYFPLIPTSVHVTDGNLVVEDDGNGNLVGDIGAPGAGITNTINYITGEFSLRLSGAATAPVVVSYTYNIEAADEYPKWGISLRGVTVEALPRAMATEWSYQAVTDLMRDWGIDAEPTILDAGAKILSAEKFKHVVNHLRKRASGGTMVWENTQPTGITYRDHIDSFGIMLTRLQHELWTNTQRVRPNVCVFSPDIWFLFQYTQGFTGEGAPGQTDSLAGPKKAGVLSNHGITCIADPTYPSGSALLTYRGSDILNTAAVVGMYIPLYKAPIHAKYFKKDTALLTEYAIHVVNSEMMGKIRVTHL